MCGARASYTNAMVGGYQGYDIDSPMVHDMSSYSPVFPRSGGWCMYCSMPDPVRIKATGNEMIDRMCRCNIFSDFSKAATLILASCNCRRQEIHYDMMIFIHETYSGAFGYSANDQVRE